MMACSATESGRHLRPLDLRDGKPQYLADTPRFIASHPRHAAATSNSPLRLVESIAGIEAPMGFALTGLSKIAA